MCVCRCRKFRLHHAPAATISRPGPGPAKPVRAAGSWRTEPARGGEAERKQPAEKPVGGEIAKRIAHACTPRHPCAAAYNRRRALGLSKPFGGRPACWSKGRSSPPGPPGYRLRVGRRGMTGLAGYGASAPSLPVLSKLLAGVGLGRPNPPLVQQEGHLLAALVELALRPALHRRTRTGSPRALRLRRAAYDVRGGSILNGKIREGGGRSKASEGS